MTHQFDLNKPSHLIANDVLRQLEILMSGSGLHVTFGTQAHDLIEGLVAQYQDKLSQERQPSLLESRIKQEADDDTAELQLRSLLAAARLPGVTDVYVARGNTFYVTFADNPAREDVRRAQGLQLRMERTQPLINRWRVVFEPTDNDED